MGVNMIKPKDGFSAFCGCFFVSHTLTMEKKYEIQEWIYSKGDFYIYMYDKDAISKTTYYVELM